MSEVADDMLRAALAHGVSALDHYIHELVRVTMLSCARGERPRTPAFDRFSVPLSNALDGSDGQLSKEAWLNPAVVEQHELLSFQRADKIADAIRLIHEVPNGLWPGVAAHLGANDAKDVKDRLGLVVDRRNQIVHQDDADASGARSPIDSALVLEALMFVTNIVDAIDGLIP